MSLPVEPFAWPAALVQELAERRVVLVLGAGVSATAHAEADPDKRPPGWATLLTELAEASVAESPKLSTIKDLVAAGRFPDAAEVLQRNSDAASFDLRLRQLLLEPRYQASAVHDYIMQLDQPVVVSLNFDRIYEAHCDRIAPEQYVVCPYYEDGFVNYLRSSRRVVLKLHGSADTAGKIVLSRTQYAEAKRNYESTYQIFGALLLTRTVFFVGCGFNGDPDVDALLEEKSLAVPSAYPHYALIAEGEGVEEVRVAQTEIMNVKFLEYPAPALEGGGRDHSAAQRLLADLTTRVLETRERAV